MARTSRPPIIVVMGHIDHGKSTLLDYIRKTNVAEKEAGGITQRVSAYVATHNDRSITFLDTPGHEAFKTVRARGALAADIAILVVAADEGVMPQTLDALKAITDAHIPYVVAITKMDKNNADIERTKTSLLEHEILLEGLGGDIPYAPISSKTGDGVPELLDLVLLAADLAELSTDPSQSATGFVLESTQDPKRGAAATLVVKDGTLSLKDFVVAGDAFAPVRFIEDFLGKRVTEAHASDPVQIAGFSKLPGAGALFQIVKNKKEAEALSTQATKQLQKGARSENASGKTLPVILKADTTGSIDAITHEISKLSSDRMALEMVSSGVGSVTENDIKVALATNAIIIAFTTPIETLARDLADREHVVIQSSSIIYDLLEKLQEVLTNRTPKEKVEKELGRAKVLKLFSSTSKRHVLGVRYVSGTFTLHALVKVLRGTEEIAKGRITNLQQARADVKEIRTEGDFGMEVEAKVEPMYGDEIVEFIEVEI